jgi:hypothetical protein
MIFPTLSPTLLLGPPGIGKTARVKAAFPYVEVIPTSGWSDEDINGLPYRDGGIEKRTLPLWYTRIQEASNRYERVALFFDEIDKTPVSVANTLLTLIESRQHGNIELPYNCAIVAAANGRGEISDALWERFSKVDCKVDFAGAMAFLESKARSEPAKLFINGLRTTALPLVSLDTTGKDGEQHRSMIPRTCELFIHACNEYPDNLVALIEYAKGLFPAREVAKIQNLFAKASSQNETAQRASFVLQRKGAIRL